MVIKDTINEESSTMRTVEPGFEKIPRDAGTKTSLGGYKEKPDMSTDGYAPKRGNVGKLGGKASAMAPTTAEPLEKEIKFHMRKLGVRNKQRLTECISQAEALKKKYPSWETERIAKKLLELSAVNMR